MDQKVKLVSSDGESFELDVDAVSISEFLNNNVNECDVVEVNLEKIHSSLLKDIVEFMAHHVDEPLPEIEKPLRSKDLRAAGVPEWYANFAASKDQERTFRLIEAANFLNCQPLLTLLCASVVSKIKGKNLEEMMEVFGITDPLTPEELEGYV